MPEPPKIEPERRRKPALSKYQLQEKARLPEDWQLPDDWRDCAKQQRPDLVAKIGEVAENFADYHRSKDTLSACWFASGNAGYAANMPLEGSQKAHRPFELTKALSHPGTRKSSPIASYAGCYRKQQP